MPRKLEGAVVVITGASSGIGRATGLEKVPQPADRAMPAAAEPSAAARGGCCGTTEDT